ncbi:MAG: RNA polymerase sigma factor [Bacteroidota bacterium]
MEERLNSEKNTVLLSADELTFHIRACSLNNRESQKKIYSSFYGYAMAICDRYASNQDDAVEIINDGFLKIFREIPNYQPAYSDVVSSFKGWLRKIMIYTAIDHFRKYHKHQMVKDLDTVVYHVPAHTIDALDRISHEEIISSVQQLSPAYRAVFNLFVIEDLSHEEISKHLGISVGTSKSNLAKARKQLQKILFKEQQNEIAKNAV